MLPFALKEASKRHMHGFGIPRFKAQALDMRQLRMTYRLECFY